MQTLSIRFPKKRLLDSASNENAPHCGAFCLGESLCLMILRQHRQEPVEDADKRRISLLHAKPPHCGQKSWPPTNHLKRRQRQYFGIRSRSSLSLLLFLLGWR